MVHHHLEGCWRISESKEHHSRFIKPVFGFERCLVLIPHFDLYIVIPPSDIELGEYVHLLYLCDEF